MGPGRAGAAASRPDPSFFFGFFLFSLLLSPPNVNFSFSAPQAPPPPPPSHFSVSLCVSATLWSACTRAYLWGLPCPVSSLSQTPVPVPPPWKASTTTPSLRVPQSTPQHITCALPMPLSLFILGCACVHECVCARVIRKERKSRKWLFSDFRCTHPSLSLSARPQLPAPRSHMSDPPPPTWPTCHPRPHGGGGEWGAEGVEGSR